MVYMGKGMMAPWYAVLVLPWYCRGWYYHKEYKAWLTRAPNTEPLQKTDRCGGGHRGPGERVGRRAAWGVLLQRGSPCTTPQCFLPLANRSRRFERGSFFLFDPTTWEVVRKDNFVVQARENTFLQPFFYLGSRLHSYASWGRGWLQALLALAARLQSGDQPAC